MKLQSKWATWTPSEKEEKTEVPEVPQGGFGTSGTESFLHMQIFKSPEGPGEELHLWATKRCVFRDRQWGSVKGLYRDYCRWSAVAERTPCLADTFLDWIIHGGLVVDALGLVYGLVLVDDAKGGWVQ
jgi:hypothetical protein